MCDFTELETAVLHAIFAETPDLRNELESQFKTAKVIARENSGVGFFTKISVSEDVPPVACPSPLGREIGASVQGLDHGMGFVLFLKDGRLRTLEGFTYDDPTAELDLNCLNFEVRKDRRF